MSKIKGNGRRRESENYKKTKGIITDAAQLIGTSNEIILNC